MFGRRSHQRDNSDLFEKVGIAFKSLRKLGYVARQRFMCCGNCAGCAIAIDIEKMSEARRAKVRGAVFYTRQDADVRDGKLFIGYGPVDTAKCGEVGGPVADVGAALHDALVAAGCKVDWDGDTSKRIVAFVD